MEKHTKKNKKNSSPQQVPEEKESYRMGNLEDKNESGMKEKMKEMMGKEIEEVNGELMEGTLADITENEHMIIAKFKMPDVKEEEIMINITNHKVEIKAEKKNKLIQQDEDFFREGITYKNSYRSVILPQEIIPEQSETIFKDGILTIRMMKSKEPNKRRLRLI